MSTIEELHAQINARRQDVEKAKAEVQHASRELDEATARQHLRRQLEQVERDLASHRLRRDNLIQYRTQIDCDEWGPAPGDDRSKLSPGAFESVDGNLVQGSLDFGAAVVHGEMEWCLKGFSWLRETLMLTHFEEEFVSSPCLTVGRHDFYLCYHPDNGYMGSHDQRASLAICHDDPPGEPGASFRYTIWIYSKHRGYVQWGTTEHVCMARDTDDMLFGPDVVKDPAIPTGLFGMSHTELMVSEWVIDDVMCAKLKVEVRPICRWEEQHNHCNIVVPPPSLCDKLLSILNDDDIGADVTFIIQGERVQAHSQILSAASEVFKRQLTCGMQETTTKEIKIDDCDPVIFRAFLRYLYSDNVGTVGVFITKHASAHGPSNPSHSGGSSGSEDRRRAAMTGTAATRVKKMQMLQQLLALGHKYQLSRLQLWCERELLDCITVDNVCNVLCQAHLFEANDLVQKCLDFIKGRMAKVVQTEAFATMSREWPLVSLKVTLYNSGVSIKSAESVSSVENLTDRKSVV